MKMTSGKALRPVFTGESQNYKLMGITVFIFHLDWGHGKKSSPTGCNTCSPV